VNFDALKSIERMKQFTEFRLSEAQFAQLLGRSRMYPFLSKEKKYAVPLMPLKDSQLNNITKEYYTGKYFSRESDGSIDLWTLFNLFTGSNKSSYIDTFLDRGAHSSAFIQTLWNSLKRKEDCWYLN